MAEAKHQHGHYIHAEGYLEQDFQPLVHLHDLKNKNSILPRE